MGSFRIIQPTLGMLRRTKGIFLSIFFSLTCHYAQTQDISLLRHIQQDSAVDLYLTTDWKLLHRHKKEKTYLPAQIVMVPHRGDTMSLPLKVRTRGNMRLNICSFPPVKLKFDKGELAKRSLSPQNEIDLVHPCHEGEVYEQYILKEYLAYKLYQQLSPVSYHVQLVKIHYLNADSSEANKPSYAFLVENSDELAERLNGKRNKTEIISKNGIDDGSMLRLCLFQYMIGNTDWNIRNRHNLEFLVVPGYNLLVPVPYDFDYSGLVAASYAAHHESLKLPAITARYYQGLCASGDDVEKHLQYFRDRKQILLSTCQQMQGINDRALNHTLGYLEEFFEIIENPKKTQSFITRHCDKWPVAN